MLHQIKKLKMAERKFSTSTILLSVALFILLSVPDSVRAESQCYWCGPLADQVHRSRRAPPCDAPSAHVTTCDEGFPHCAIVATAPPYIESRYCVKIYQDECYLDFCNTTKTWKMTCPCKGNLCNEQNTDRDEAAFAELIATIQKSLKNRTKKSIKEPLIRSIQTEEKKSAMVDPDVNKTSEIELITESIENDKISPTNSPPNVTQQENKQNTTTEENESNTSNTDFNIFETVTTPYGVESTVVKYLESDYAENLIKSSEKLPTAEALQSEKSDTPSDNEEIESTISDDKAETTTEAALATDQPISRENAANCINLSLYSLILIICIKL